MRPPPHIWMNLTVPEPGAAPRLHITFRDNERRAAHHRCRPALLWTHRLQEPPARRGHIAVHTGPHRAISSPQFESHRRSKPPDKLLEEFPGLTKPTGSHREVRHKTTQHIRTTPGPPAAWRPRRLRPFRRGQCRVRRHAEQRYSQTPWPIVVRPPSSARGQRLETLWKLPSSQGSHHP